MPDIAMSILALCRLLPFLSGRCLCCSSLRLMSALACDGASMTSFPDPARFARQSLAAALFAAAMSTCASAADMPETILRGGTYSEPSPDYMRWDGVSLGATFGWTNITVDYSSAFAAGTTTRDQTNSAQFA